MRDNIELPRGDRPQYLPMFILCTVLKEPHQYYAIEEPIYNRMVGALLIIGFPSLPQIKYYDPLIDDDMLALFRK